MIEMGEDGATRLFPVFVDRDQAAAEDVARGRSVVIHWLDDPVEVDHIDVDGLLAARVRHLLGRQKVKLTRLLERGAAFRERFQNDAFLAPAGLAFEPVFTKAGLGLAHGVATDGLLAFADGLEVHPFLAFLEDVVIAHSDEVVAALAIPIEDHLGKVVPVAPERMGVRVALEPCPRVVVLRGEGQGQAEEKERENFHAETHSREKRGGARGDLAGCGQWAPDAPLARWRSIGR